MGSSEKRGNRGERDMSGENESGSGGKRTADDRMKRRERWAREKEKRKKKKEKEMAEFGDRQMV